MHPDFGIHAQVMQKALADYRAFGWRKACALNHIAKSTLYRWLKNEQA